MPSRQDDRSGGDGSYSNGEPLRFGYANGYRIRVNEPEIEAMESLDITLPERVYERLQARAAASELSIGNIVADALDEFLTMIEKCDPAARAVARNLAFEDD